VPYLDAVTEAPISRRSRGVPSEILVGIDEGLKQSSAADLHALQTVPKDRVGRFLGSLGRERTRELRAAVLFALDLDD
jgi:mRNA-degrading endonuclease toxin of MazEF toxin-antitoxin module